MVKFKTLNKGTITQYFGGSPSWNPTQYSTRGQSGHNGVDTVKGWNAPCVSDNDAHVYKVIRSHQSRENWQGVYMLVYDPKTNHWVEICQGHFNEILVEAGMDIPEGLTIGLEGNKGYVFSGVTQITAAMQKAGDTRAAHVHTSYRPTVRVRAVKKGEYYLLNINGTKYRDKDGYYYQIVYKNNGYNGCVNPFLYLDEDTLEEKITFLTKLRDWLLIRKQK